MNNSQMMQLVGAVQRTADDNTKTWWTNIGVAFENRDGSRNLRFDYLPTNPNTTVQMRPMRPKEDAEPANVREGAHDASARHPHAELGRANNAKMMQLVGAVQRTGDDNAKTWWTNIGVAFENRDGSWNLRFDYLPTNPNTTIQMRLRPKEDAEPANEEAV